MTTQPPLQGIRIHLAGSVPDGISPEAATGIRAFVQQFASAVFREGGTLIHGSHPTFIEPLRTAAQLFVSAGGTPEALTLVRPSSFASTPEQMEEMEAQREFSTVHIIPTNPRVPTDDLVPMREWMAERCDVVVAIGGKWYDVNKSRAGVPEELDESIRRGKPAFLIAGFGGAVQGYLEDKKSLIPMLRNGLSDTDNHELATSTAVEHLTSKIISQIKLLPLIRQRMPRGRLFRILTLDGGGLRGTFTAAVLAKWDDMLKDGGGDNLVKHFDLVAGTSTGSILAIGLGLGIPPKEMLAFYRNQGPMIFPRDRKLRHWLRSKYDSRDKQGKKRLPKWLRDLMRFKYASKTLEETLREVFHDRTLSGDSCCRLVIPTVRAINGESEVIVTAHSPDRTGFKSTTAVEAALASSAAPTYFDEAHLNDGIATQGYLDGGIWANNPILPAIAEAIRHLEVPIDRIDVLSVGTMGNERDFMNALGKGKLGWATDSADLFFAAQESAATTLADCLLGGSRHLRINQPTPCEIKLDDREAIEDMAERGANVGMKNFASVRSRFLDGFHAPDWRTEVDH
jgi:uncharacterized protein